MNREEVIEIAKQAGFAYDPIANHAVAVDGHTEVTVTPGIDRVATEVERRTLERAAMVCDERADDFEESADYEETEDYKERYLVYAKHIKLCARRIRALGEK